MGDWQEATWRLGNGNRINHEQDLESEIINLYPSLHAPFDSTTLQHLTLQRGFFSPLSVGGSAIMVIMICLT